VNVDLIAEIISRIILVVIAVVGHEIAHGYAALYEGDTTARDAGRLTLNVFAHIDPFMSVILPGLLLLTGSPILFGAAKPVPVNPYRFRHGEWGDVLVSAAGPGANLAMAAVLGALGTLVPAFHLIGYAGVLINVVLAVFNLLPIPPLDGSRIIAPFLPPRWRWQWHRLDQYGFLFLFMVLFFFNGILWRAIGPVIDALVAVFTWRMF